MTIKRTNAQNPHFHQLVQRLDADLAITDGEDHAFYHQFNGSEDLEYVIVAELDGNPVGCGALKYFAEDAVEIKRMYAAEEARRRGVATAVLRELEDWARELGYERAVLETGSRQLAALALYDRNGYRRLPENYGQYAGVDNSVCMEKRLR